MTELRRLPAGGAVLRAWVVLKPAFLIVPIVAVSLSTAGCAEAMDDGLDVPLDMAWDDIAAGEEVTSDLDDELEQDEVVEGTDMPLDSVEDDGTLPEDTLDPPPDTADTALDPPIEDLVPDPEIEPEPDIVLPWDEAVCGLSGEIPDCTMLCISPATYSQDIMLPDLAPGKVIRLEIQLEVRRILGVQMSFDDLECSLTSPSGTEVTFWNRFYGGHSWESSYIFTASWDMPNWWDEDMGGRWTFDAKDHLRTGAFSPYPTTLTSICLTPVDPAEHALVDPTAHIELNAPASRSITDYCYNDSPDPCNDHPIQFEYQVDSLVQAFAAPSLSVNIAHPAPSELKIEVFGPEGSSTTVWDRSGGDLPASFSLSSFTGKWMTGRWALRISDHVEGNVGTFSGCTLEVN